MTLSWTRRCSEQSLGNYAAAVVAVLKPCFSKLPVMQRRLRKCPFSLCAPIASTSGSDEKVLKAKGSRSGGSEALPVPPLWRGCNGASFACIPPFLASSFLAMCLFFLLFPAAPLGAFCSANAALRALCSLARRRPFQFHFCFCLKTLIRALKANTPSPVFPPLCCHPPLHPSLFLGPQATAFHTSHIHLFQWL